MAIEITPDAYLEAGDTQDLSFEEQAQNQIHRGASNYARRDRNTFEPGQEDIALHGVLAKIQQETNPLKREVLEQQAQILAAGGVVKQQRNGRRQSIREVQTSDPTEFNGSQSSMTTPYGIMSVEFGRDVLDDTLQWCARELDDSTVEYLNKGLNSSDVSAVRKAFKAALYMKNNGVKTFNR
jgi:hypothetical protein